MQTCAVWYQRMVRANAGQYDWHNCLLYIHDWHLSLSLLQIADDHVSALTLYMVKATG